VPKQRERLKLELANLMICNKGRVPIHNSRFHSSIYITIIIIIIHQSLHLWTNGYDDHGWCRLTIFRAIRFAIFRSISEDIVQYFNFVSKISTFHPISQHYVQYLIILSYLSIFCPIYKHFVQYHNILSNISTFRRISQYFVQYLNYLSNISIFHPVSQYLFNISIFIQYLNIYSISHYFAAGRYILTRSIFRECRRKMWNSRKTANSRKQ
jgi:hypothetical protein